MLCEKENEIKDLQAKIDELSKNLAEAKASEQHFSTIFDGYEKILAKVLIEHQEVTQQKQALENHTADLETTFTDLLTKYERAKIIIQGLMQNENILKIRLNQCEKIIEQIGQRYNNLQEHAMQKLNKASARLDKSDKKHIAETAKLKATILQSKVRINDLEKQISLHNMKGGNGDLITEFSMFAPLQNHFIR